MYTYDERSELLKQWKDESNLTYENLASAADVPVPTVQRIIDGKTSNPTFANVAAIVVALGHTLDEYYGVSKDESRDVTVYSLLQASYQQRLHEKDIILELMLKEKEAVIEGLRNDIANGEKSKAFLKKSFFILAAATGTALIICFVFIFLHMLTHIK